VKSAENNRNRYIVVVKSIVKSDPMHPLQRIIDEECRKAGISAAELMGGSKRRKVSEARSVIAIRSRDELGLSSAEIARHAGVNTSSITRAIERVKKLGHDTA
jgi:chromosomal replication initiation ATPase DnaA